MPNRILTMTGWCERVRQKIGVDASYLPDTAIDIPDIVGIVERYIISRVPHFESLSADDALYIESATVARCAAVLCPTMKVRLPKVERGAVYQRENSVNWDGRSRELLEESESLILKACGEDVNYPHFSTTWGG